MKRLKKYAGPILTALVLLALLGSWTYRESHLVHRQARQEIRQSAAAIASALHGSVSAQTRRGRYSTERLQNVLDNVVQTAGLEFVQLRRGGRSLMEAGDLPDNLSPVRGEAGDHLGSEAYIFWQTVRLQDRPVGRGRGRGPGWGRMMRDQDFDLDFGGSDQLLVIGLPRAGYDDHVATVMVRTWLSAGLAALAVLVVCVAWAQSIRNRSLAVELSEARARASHMDELRLAAGGLAHEIKNPLGIIRAHAQKIAGNASSDGREQKLAEDIMEEVDMTVSRLGDFLAYARSRTPEKQAVAACEVIGRAAELLKPDYEAAGIELDISCEPLTIEAEPEMLQQILVNLLLNSLNACEEDSTVQVKVSGNHETARLQVSDDGPGIPEDLREEIFKPYVSGRQNGHGLGLTIVRRMAEAHGWQADLQSSPGKGTTVTISGISVVNP